MVFINQEKGRNAALAVDGSALKENKKIQPSSDAVYSVGVCTEIISKKIDDNAIPKSGGVCTEIISKKIDDNAIPKSGGVCTEIISKKIDDNAIPKSGDSDEQGGYTHSLAETKPKTGLEAAEIYDGPVFVPAVGAFEAHRDSDEQEISKHSLGEIKTGLEAAEIYNTPVFGPAVGAFEAHIDSALAETKLKTGLEADHLAKRDDNIGMKLMKRMGYAGTGGLGPRGQGISVPIPLPKWLPDREGLGFKEKTEEGRRKKFQELKMKKDK